MIFPLKKTLVTCDKYNLNSYSSEVCTLTIQVIDYDSNPISNESVDLYLDDSLLTTVTTDSSGVATTTHSFSNRTDIGIHVFRANECIIRVRVFYDTGWLNPTFQTNYANYGSSNETLQYRCIDDVAQIVGEAKNTSAISASSGTIATIPSALAPASDVYCITQGSGANKWLSKLIDSGNLSWQRYGTTSNGTSLATTQWLVVNMMYTMKR